MHVTFCFFIRRSSTKCPSIRGRWLVALSCSCFSPFSTICTARSPGCPTAPSSINWRRISRTRLHVTYCCFITMTFTMIPSIRWEWFIALSSSCLSSSTTISIARSPGCPGTPFSSNWTGSLMHRYLYFCLKRSISSKYIICHHTSKICKSKCGTH